MNDNRIKIHFFYVTLILSIGLILAVTIRLSDDVQIVDYVNFAATVASLVLATLAIIYSFVGSASTGKMTDQLNQAAATISNVSQEVSAKTMELSAQIECIPQLINSVDEKVVASNMILEDLQTRAKSESADMPVEPIDTEKADDEAISRRIVEYNSYYGITALFCAKVSYESKKGFDIKDLCGKLEVSTEYFIAQFVLLTCLGVVEHTRNNSIYTFSHMSEALRKNVVEEIATRKKNSAYKDDLAKDISIIENQFK